MRSTGSANGFGLPRWAQRSAVFVVAVGLSLGVVVGLGSESVCWPVCLRGDGVPAAWLAFVTKLVQLRFREGGCASSVCGLLFWTLVGVNGHVRLPTQTSERHSPEALGRDKAGPAVTRLRWVPSGLSLALRGTLAVLRACVNGPTAVPQLFVALFPLSCLHSAGSRSFSLSNVRSLNQIRSVLPPEPEAMPPPTGGVGEWAVRACDVTRPTQQ
jgi:hypothetical protein